MKFFILVFIILILSSLIILESNSLKISEKNDLKIFTEKYQNWTNEIYLNIQQITGQAIKMNWIPNKE